MYQLRSHPNVGDVVVSAMIIEGITIEVVIFMPQSLLVLGNLIGSGAYGSVYEARWGCQQCAAKTFFLTQSDFDEKEIQNEVKVLQRLRHRNTVQFYRTHKQDNHIYLIMELAENGSLAKAINKGLLDWHDKTRIAHEIARGLEYIHQENVLHRDLKNIYALGVVMWEMAANCTRPYKDQEKGELIAHHVKSGYRETLPHDTPIEYRKWVERCWHHDPNQRPSASEVILVRGQQGEAGTDDGAVSVSFGFSDDEITSADTEGKPIATNHPNSAPASGRLPQTDDDVVKYFCTEAQQGSEDAQLFLGWIYSHGGEFTKKNVENSAWWYRKAAERGNATAQLILGELYENGQGVDANDREASTWYRKAAVHGVTKAQVKLGEMYKEGRGVEQNDVEAVKWYRMAADQGHGDAQVVMGTWYSLGRGVNQSDVEAVKWFIKAAEQGNVDAQNNLAMIFFEKNAEQSDVEAVKWFTKAAEQGNAPAQNNLGW
ncbi:hypothetical protein BGW42_002007, partial [Actinomortierella wolfii]